MTLTIWDPADTSKTRVFTSNNAMILEQWDGVLYDSGLNEYYCQASDIFMKATINWDSGATEAPWRLSGDDVFYESHSILDVYAAGTPAVDGSVDIAIGGFETTPHQLKIARYIFISLIWRAHLDTATGDVEDAFMMSMLKLPSSSSSSARPVHERAINKHLPLGPGGVGSPGGGA